MRQSGRRSARLSATWLWAVLLLNLCSTKLVFAQAEFVYGGPNTRERGHNGVAPVTNCVTVGGSYIAAGYSEAGAGSGVYDSYVVLHSTVGWEVTVDVNGSGGNDVAYSVVEIPAGGGSTGNGGFLVVGTTDEPGGTSTDVYAMELDCNGNVNWIKTYGVAGVAEEGRDVVLTLNGSGPPPLPGGPAPTAGDYVIAGWSAASGTLDALLLRIDVNGTLVWDNTYDTGGDDFLNAVIETNTITRGDIVAAGGTTGDCNGMGDQGLALRVDGNDGTLGLAPHGMADYGETAVEVFNNVVELTVQPEFGNLAFVGSTTYSGPTEIYVVKTDPNPCTLLAQTMVIGPIDTDINDAYDVTEVRTNYSSGAAYGDLALTGEATNQTQNSEMFLLTLRPLDLAVSTVAQTYGDQTPPGTGIYADGGRSLVEDGKGFMLCGYSMSNFLFNNDPEQLYLVKTDSRGISKCENPWAPFNQDIDWDFGCMRPILAQPMVETALHGSSNPLTTPVNVCPRRPCIIKLPNHNGEDGGRRDSPDGGRKIDLSNAILHIDANTVEHGAAVTFDVNPRLAKPFNVRVTNSRGQVVETMRAENEGGPSRFSFRTEDLPAGVYLIEVNDGAGKETVQITVTQ